MDFLDNTVKFIILIFTLVSSAGGIMLACKKAACRKVKIVEENANAEFAARKKIYEQGHKNHDEILLQLKKADRVMLECQYAILSALDDIGHGKAVNGGIKVQQDKLQEYLLNLVSDERGGN